jgi:hypothetical protein
MLDRKDIIYASSLQGFSNGMRDSNMRNFDEKSRLYREFEFGYDQ